MADFQFQCQFCGKQFVTERWFLRHKCKQMLRDEELRTPIGQSAWLYYQQWMRVYHRQVPNTTSFAHSQLYNSFIRFAKFVRKVRIPDTKIFIRLMRDKDIPPVLWNNDQVYALYLEQLDRCGNPLKQAETTINTLFDIADAAKCKVKDVFDHLTPNEMIHFLRRRQISPWFLLNSKKFQEFFVERLSNEERLITESIIRPKYWKTKFDKHPKAVETIKKYVLELKL